MIPLRSRSDSWTLTPEPHAIRIEKQFFEVPFTHFATGAHTFPVACGPNITAKSHAFN